MTLEQLIELGFDRSYKRDDDTIKCRCSQCEAMVINGTPIHETGCPNIPQPEPEKDLDEYPNEGYWYRDANGDTCHTWDFEEAIGE